MPSSEKLQRFGRYLDIDNGHPIPHLTRLFYPTKGAYFTRGSSHDEYAVLLKILQHTFGLLIDY